MTSYNPYHHAEELGIKVIHRPLRTDNGMWLPEHNTIVIKSGMRAVHDRAALAHEIGHAQLGHQDDRPKHEKQADRYAASLLIDVDQCFETLEWSPDEARTAHELGVTTRLLRAFLALHRPAA